MNGLVIGAWIALGIFVFFLAKLLRQSKTESGGEAPAFLQVMNVIACIENTAVFSWRGTVTTVYEDRPADRFSGHFLTVDYCRFIGKPTVEFFEFSLQTLQGSLLLQVVDGEITDWILNGQPLGPEGRPAADSKDLGYLWMGLQMVRDAYEKQHTSPVGK